MRSAESAGLTSSSGSVTVTQCVSVRSERPEGIL